jgi:hypothetical protein
VVQGYGIVKRMDLNPGTRNWEQTNGEFISNFILNKDDLCTLKHNVNALTNF